MDPERWGVGGSYPKWGTGEESIRWNLVKRHEKKEKKAKGEGKVDDEEETQPL